MILPGCMHKSEILPGGAGPLRSSSTNEWVLVIDQLSIETGNDKKWSLLTVGISRELMFVVRNFQL